MPRAGTARRRRERAGLPPVKPGKPSWVHGTKLVFFQAFKDDFLAAAEIKATGPFYSRVGQLYLDKYGYHTAWNDDLPDGEDVADDVDPDEDVDSLDPEEADFRAAYFKQLRQKIGVWYNSNYGGGVGKALQPKSFKQLFDKRELEPPLPVKAARHPLLLGTLLHREDQAARRGAMGRDHAPAAGETSGFDYGAQYGDEGGVVGGNTSIPSRGHAVLGKGAPSGIGDLQDCSCQRYPPLLLRNTMCKALNHSAYYLQPFADTAHAQFGMNIAILMCGPIPDRGGRIEVRSVHAGFSNGLVPRIWSDFDRAGFDVAQRSFVAFTRNCFTEEECRARALDHADTEEGGAESGRPATPVPTPPPPPPIMTTMPAPTTHAPTTTQEGAAPVTTTNETDGEDHLLRGRDDHDNWGDSLQNQDPLGVSPPLIGPALEAEIAAMSAAEGVAFVGLLWGVTEEEAFDENERAESRAQRTTPAADDGEGGGSRADPPDAKASVPLERPAEGIEGAAGAGATQETVVRAPLQRPEANPDAEDVEGAAANPDAEGVECTARTTQETVVRAPLQRPEANPDAEGPLPLGVERAARVTRATNAKSVQEEVATKTLLDTSVWDAEDEESWTDELKAAFHAFERAKDWGEDEWEACIEALLAFERSLGFPATGQPVPQGDKTIRPEEVPTFMKRRREWDKRISLVTPPGPAGAGDSFADRWWIWWKRVQPTSRVMESGKLGDVDKATTAEWAQLARMGGKNGMLLYVGALLWWGEAAAEADESQALLDDWKVALREVAQVLTKGKEVNDSAESLESAEENGDAVGAKRKRAVERSPEQEKENAPPKYYHDIVLITVNEFWAKGLGVGWEEDKASKYEPTTGRSGERRNEE
ncbi:hypothetical protein B0H14DRAFT_2574477 [Mycena olivaceomarginata]|nr:hypothetical protein B0H14DRAFT_2574477 [Mycena olivaceomarginata]